MKVALLTVVLALFAPQTSPQNNNGAAAATAVIQGTVARSDTSAGIPDVQITLNIPATQAPGTTATTGAPQIPSPPAAINVTTDGSGHFTVRNLVPGRYTVRAQKEGYFGTNVNGTAPTTVFKSVTIDPQKKEAEANFVLVQGGVVSGHLRDPNGQPISGISVAAQRLTYTNGRATLSMFSSKATDDRGEYRIFWLAPGEYYVGMIPRSPSPIPGPQDSWLRTFYPGVSDIATASTVLVKEGTETSVSDFVIRTAPTSDTFKISGKVINPMASPNPATGVLDRSINTFFLAPRETSILDGISPPTVANALSTTARANGEFEIRNVRPGSYDLFPLVMDNTNRRYYTNRTPVEIRNSDVQDLTIAIGQGTPLTGQVLVNGSAPARPESIRLTLRPLDNLPVTFVTIIAATQLDSTGSFTIPDIPEGRYTFQITGLPDTAYVENMRLGSQNVFDDGFTIEHTLPGTMQVLVNTSGAMIDGIVQNSDQKPAAGATVVLVPPPSRRQNQALYRFGSTDEMGHFIIRGVAPGDYKLFAWESIPPTAWQNAEYLGKYEQRGQAIHVEQRGGSNTVLTLISEKP